MCTHHTVQLYCVCVGCVRQIASARERELGVDATRSIQIDTRGVCSFYGQVGTQLSELRLKLCFNIHLRSQTTNKPKCIALFSTTHYRSQLSEWHCCRWLRILCGISLVMFNYRYKPVTHLKYAADISRFNRIACYLAWCLIGFNNKCAKKREIWEINALRNAVNSFPQR